MIVPLGGSRPTHIHANSVIGDDQRKADERDRQRLVVLQEPAGLLRRAGRAHQALRPGHGDGQPVARGQRLGGAEHDAARTLLDDGGVLSARALRPGVERRLPQRNRLGQCDARLGLIDGEGPAGAGGVPIELVVVEEEADLPRGAIGDDVFVPAGAEKAIGTADADPDAVAQSFRGPVFRGAVAGDGTDLEADLDARAVLAGVGGRKIPQDAAADLVAFGLHARSSR